MRSDCTYPILTVLDPASFVSHPKIEASPASALLTRRGEALYHSKTLFLGCSEPRCLRGRYRLIAHVAFATGATLAINL